MKLTIPAAPEAPRPAPIPDRLPWRDGAIVGLAWGVLVSGLAGLASIILALFVAWLAGALWALIVGGVGLLLSLAVGAGVGVWHGAFAIIGWTQDHVSLRLYPAPVTVVQETPAPVVPSQIKVTLERSNDGGYQSYQYRNWPGDMAILARELCAGRPFTVRAFKDILTEDRLQALRELLISDNLAVWKTGEARHGCELTPDGWEVMRRLSPTPPPPAEIV